MGEELLCSSQEAEDDIQGFGFFLFALDHVVVFIKRTYVTWGSFQMWDVKEADGDEKDVRRCQRSSSVLLYASLACDENVNSSQHTPVIIIFRLTFAASRHRRNRTYWRSAPARNTTSESGEA